MKKLVSFVALIACYIGLSGCSSTPEIQIETPTSLSEEFQQRSADIIESGGLAAVGTARSKSLDIAINKAQADGRIKLADRLETRMNGLPENLADQIQGLAAKELKHEITNDVVTAYALMELNPNVLSMELNPNVLSQEIKPLSDK